MKLELWKKNSGCSMGWAGQSTPTKVICWLFKEKGMTLSKQQGNQIKRVNFKHYGSSLSAYQGVFIETLHQTKTLSSQQQVFILGHLMQEENKIPSFPSEMPSSQIWYPKISLQSIHFTRQKNGHISLTIWHVGVDDDILFCGLDHIWIGHIIRHLFQMDAWKIPLKSSCSHQRYIYIYT